MERIRFQNLRPHGKLARELNAAYDKVFNSGFYVGGKEVTAFEEDWAEYTQSKYAIGVGCGHDALTLACKFFSSGEYHLHTFVPWKTCLPTWSAVRNAGLFPRPEDSGSCMVTVAVHVYGQITLPDRPRVNVLIEDCAQAHGAKLNGIPAGKFGRVAAWSFFPTKNLGALGDAGAVTTDDYEIAEYVRKMRNYGDKDESGINSRLDPLQAAFLRVKLPYLDKWNKRRAENALMYYQTINYIDLPFLKFGEEPSWHIFAIETDYRDELKEFLASHYTETMVHYPTVPYPSNWHIPEAEAWTKRTLSLPIAPHVTPEQCHWIGTLINQWMENK